MGILWVPSDNDNHARCMADANVKFGADRTKEAMLLWMR